MTIYRNRQYVVARERLLRERPVCERCGEKPAVEAHHRAPLSRGGDPYSLDNLEALCVFCHRGEHAP